MNFHGLTKINIFCWHLHHGYSYLYAKFLSNKYFVGILNSCIALPKKINEIKCPTNKNNVTVQLLLIIAEPGSPGLASLTQQVAQFGREMVDLLKAQPHCRLALSRFIPAYHQHFGRQCRVADYGYSRLSELLDAVPHIVQVKLSKILYLCWTNAHAIW